MYADALLRPWLDELAAAWPDVRLFDAHSHVGEHDPSGMTATVEELLDACRLAGARAVVFPLSEPEGYAAANLRCARAAASSEGVLVAFARVTPYDRPAELLEDALAAGARGLKLHPSSDEFDLDDPRLLPALSIAERHRLPVVVHAGPELAGIGETALGVCRRFPGVHLILAHCALTDLAWIGTHVTATPNLFFDTAWWSTAHLMALFRAVPPGRVLLGSDLPYSTPLSHAVTTLRCAAQAGLDERQIASVAGGQLQRLLDGEPIDVGPPPRAEARPLSPELEVLAVTLMIALEPMQRGESPGTLLAVARHACKVPSDHPDAEVVASVARLLDLYEAHHERLPRRNQFAPGWDLVSAAAVVARTPAVHVRQTDVRSR